MTEVPVRVQGEPAFVMHSRPFRETSAIVDLFTPNHGLVSAVARGVRGARRRGRRDGGGNLVPFSRLVIAYAGRGPLYTLAAAEPVRHHWLKGAALYAGLYVNELSLRLVRPHDAHPELFAGYEATVSGLDAAAVDIEPVLRRFEKLLLRTCGYELIFDRDAGNAEPVRPERLYRFVPEQGFVAVQDSEAGGLTVTGAELLAIAADDYSGAPQRRAAKRIMRRALAPHIGDKGLRARALFREQDAS